MPPITEHARRPAPCPAILAGADTSRRSSTTPTTTISVAASTMPSGSVLPEKIVVERVERHAVSMPDEEADEHGDAAERRRRTLVHAPLVGLDDRADADGQPAHERRGDEA